MVNGTNRHRPNSLTRRRVHSFLIFLDVAAGYFGSDSDLLTPEKGRKWDFDRSLWWPGTVRAWPAPM